MIITSARGVKTATNVRALSESDLQLGIAEIKGTSAITSWTRRGKLVNDIEFETSNAIISLDKRDGYKKLRNKICSKYKIDEREFVRQLFQRMTRR